MKKSLSDICEFVKGRVEVSNLSVDNYISTENMLPEKGGISQASKLPNTSTTSSYIKGDILISNIRPYFKKIWLADRDGGCSNDVLVLRAREGVLPTFLYYVLADNRFFDYATATSKGTKMPRGDKLAIMKYQVPNYSLEEQLFVANTLSCLDRKISLNAKINHHLVV